MKKSILTFIIISFTVFSSSIFALNFSENELYIIKQSKLTPITIGVIDNSPPLCYWNSEKNKYDGITIEILNTITKRIGLSVEYVPVDMTRRNLAKNPTDKSPNIILGATYSPNLPDTRGWILSDSIYTGSLAAVGKRNNSILDGKNKKVAIMKQFGMAIESIKINLPDYQIVEYDSLIDCLDDVAKEKVNLAVYVQSCLSYSLQKPLFQDLEIIPTYYEPLQICVAGFTESSRVIIDIINKGLSIITPDENRMIALNFTINNPYTLTMSDIIYKYYFPILVIVLMVMVVIFSLSIAFLMHVKSSEKVKEALHIAERASVAKGSFMSRMSHEIRTPLNAIIGYNAIAKNELTSIKTETQRRQAEVKVMDCLSKSDIASKHLLSIINDVLDMSAIENGKIRTVAERFDFKGLITSITTIFYSQAKTKNVNFEVIFSSQVDEWVIGDQMRVNQILTNLLSNAIKFTSEGGNVTLLINATCDTEKTNINFEIKDTGIGMSDEYISRLWAPFEQADASISRRFGGTGLGLAITKNLIDLLNGNISVKSKLGEGSTFIVTIPFEKTEQSEKTRLYNFSNMNILIVDDDHSTCDYIQLLLSRAEIRSTSVTSGYDAISVIKRSITEEKPYTMCLIDWRMPKMDGLETVKKIREIVGEKLPIIVITAYDFSEIADQASKMGVNMFISKPLFQSSLFNLLLNIAGKENINVDAIKISPENFSNYKLDNAYILLAEDNKMNMEIASKILENTGCKVDKAWNGKEAVSLFENQPANTYDLILMDVQMPEMDGFEATRLIRQSKNKHGETIPIIALTADAFAENIAESHNAGMNDHISKPLDFEVFFKTLSKYLN